jgi:hypothetical protein
MAGLDNRSGTHRKISFGSRPDDLLNSTLYFDAEKVIVMRVRVWLQQHSDVSSTMPAEISSAISASRICFE